MDCELQKVVEAVVSLKKERDPLGAAWRKAFSVLELDSPWIEYGLSFLAKSGDAYETDNAYHNKLHIAETVVCAAFLAKAEYESREELAELAPLLLFTMLCHDLKHTGGSNLKPFELEAASVKAMNEIAETPELEELWKTEVKPVSGSRYYAFEVISNAIYATDFAHSFASNLRNYCHPVNGSVPQNVINLLANEADLLPSSMEQTGMERSKQLAEETGIAAIGTLKGRLGFLENMAKYVSKGSSKIGVQKDVVRQIALIKESATA